MPKNVRYAEKLYLCIENKPKIKGMYQSQFRKGSKHGFSITKNKLAALCAGFLLVFFHGNLQGQIEIIGLAGSSHFLGDLGGKPLRGTNDISDLDIQSTRWGLGAGARIFLSKKIALRGNLIWARVSGDDKYTSNPERRGRNSNFFSPIVEGSAMFEWHLNRKLDRYGNSTGGLYLFGGGGMFYFEPKTRYDGRVIDLRPLGTEGQFYRDDLEPYDNYSFSIPFGFGYRFALKNGGLLGIELNTRKTFTDYIDDVSTTFADPDLLLQSNGALAVTLADRSTSTIPGFNDPGAIRGNPDNNDTFFFLFITYSHPLGSDYYGGLGPSGKRKRGRGKKGKNKCFEF